MANNLKVFIEIIVICLLLPCALSLDCHLCHEGYECRTVACSEAVQCVILKGQTMGNELEYHANCEEPKFCADSDELKDMKARFYLQSLQCDTFCNTDLCNLPPGRQHATRLLTVPLLIILKYFLLIFLV